MRRCLIDGQVEDTVTFSSIIIGPRLFFHLFLFFFLARPRATGAAAFDRYDISHHFFFQPFLH